MTIVTHGRYRSKSVAAAPGRTGPMTLGQRNIYGIQNAATDLKKSKNFPKPLHNFRLRCIVVLNGISFYKFCFDGFPAWYAKVIYSLNQCLVHGCGIL